MRAIVIRVAETAVWSIRATLLGMGVLGREVLLDEGTPEMDSRIAAARVRAVQVPRRLVSTPIILFRIGLRRFNLSGRFDQGATGLAQ